MKSAWRRGLVLLFLATGAARAAPGSLLRDETLRPEPAASADGPTLVRGTGVDIRERRGGWLRVAADGREGWVRVLSVRGDAAARRDVLGEAKAVLTRAEPRINTHVVAVAGFRGAEDEGAAGRAALAALDRHRLAPGGADDFAQAGGLARQRVDCPRRPAGAEEAPVRGLPKGVTLSLMSAWSLDRLTPEHEARIGAYLAGRLLAALPPVRDDALQDYVNQVGRWLADQGEDAGQPWMFAVLEDDAVQAFGLPGGHVFLTRGLYRRLADEAELAAVLAREIAKARAHALIRALRAGPAPASAAGRPRDEAGFLACLLGDGSAALNRALPADAEFAADRDGVSLAARAGYDAYALAGVLQSLGELAGDDARAGLMRGSLPPPELRLRHLDEAMGECLAATRPGRVPNRFDRID